MQNIHSILNNLTGKEILQSLKEKNTKALFIGKDNPSDEDFENFLKNPNITLDDLKPYAFISTDIRRAYFDTQNCLCFEINLDYDIASENTIYALALVNEESIFTLALTPKIKKLQGIGGTFIVKTSLEGFSGEMVFKSDSYISEAEFEPFKNFVNNFEPLLAEFKAQAKTKMLLLDLEHYLDTELENIKLDLQKQNTIGKKSYFYRNSLPSDYIGMGEVLKRDEYPLLWYHTLGFVGNDGREYFRIPRAGYYSKGTQESFKVGSMQKSGLPNILGQLYGGCDNLSGDGVFRNEGGGYWHWSGGNGEYSQNRVSFDASRANSIYGRSEDVEVNAIFYLEGIYAGEKLSPSTK
ncbi:hypothetical protein BKH42_06870 [Helicobacter sp. 13S00482-2]|uniref:hypothetical protein n=1 Tax=Helicobacter sp. 13S00482-2 TaxID=1476200 RepID=UPI000BA62DDC|nr:hypothetical protein [Helicobacter sp. 13S00482-2]PAF53244.1 hypothetical protein BKH42_06870 [Helicobacter sp. 13S00482-2]